MKWRCRDSTKNEKRNNKSRSAECFSHDLTLNGVATDPTNKWQSLYEISRGELPRTLRRDRGARDDNDMA